MNGGRGGEEREPLMLGMQMADVRQSVFSLLKLMRLKRQQKPRRVPLHYFVLLWAVLGLHCSAWAVRCGARALECTGSLAEALRLTCSITCGILFP